METQYYGFRYAIFDTSKYDFVKNYKGIAIYLCFNIFLKGNERVYIKGG